MKTFPLSRPLIAACLLFLLILCGCSSQPGASLPISTQNTSGLIIPGRWKIEFMVSGGLRGLQRQMEISDAGMTTVFDQINKKQVTIQLPDEELLIIGGLLPGATQLQPVSRLPACADCYQYEINIQMDTQHFFFRVNDINLAGSGLAPLVQTLMDVQQGALAGQFK